MVRRRGLDFVRAIGAIGIIAFHFYCHSSSNYKLFLNHANGTWGSVLNHMFFALSGLVLHLKYGSQKTQRLGEFYYKRWRATLPAYIIVFLYAFLMNVFTYGKVFYLDIPNERLLLSFIGMDGLVSWTTTTYFITGEWFLGAILIVYSLYPFLKAAMGKSKTITMLMLIALFIGAQTVDFLGLPLKVNPITCLLSFGVGMLLSNKQACMNNNIIVTVCALLTAVLVIVPFNSVEVVQDMLIGWLLLVVIYHIGERVCRNDAVYRAVSFVSGLAYFTFLIHHQLVVKVLEGFDTTSTMRSAFVLIMIIAVTIVLAKILDIVMHVVMNSKLFKALDRCFLEGRQGGA